MNEHENNPSSEKDPAEQSMPTRYSVPEDSVRKGQERIISGSDEEFDDGLEDSGISAGEELPGISDKGKAQKQKEKKEESDSVEESVIYWQQTDDISDSLNRTKATLQEVVGLGKSFDIVFREMNLAGQKTGLFSVNGFAKDNILLEILKRLTYLSAEQLSTDALKSFFECYIPHIQVEVDKKLSSTINKVLTGMSALFIEGEHTAIVMDTRTFPVRSPEEPSIERVVRGARDGFTETLLTNITLVRRRLRDPGFITDLVQVGRRTRTDVCIAYIDDIVDKVQVDSIREKIKGLDIEGLPLADKQLEEGIINKGWHPYPLVRYSERPDVVSAHLLEGRVAVFVDTSPSVMIMPTTFFDLLQHAEENRQTPFMGTYLRWIRFLGIFASLFLLPLWLLIVLNPELKPPFLDIIGPHDKGRVPLLVQFLMVEFGVDLLRLAAVHTPTPLASAMGLIAAILVGDIAVKSGLFINEVVLYMAVAAIGMYATPSYELGLANRMVRLVLLVAVAIFKVQGFVVGTTLLILLLTLNRSYNSSYLWPFIPFNAKGMANVLFRFPLLESKKRPSFNKPKDNTRMAPNPDNTDQT
ncbi:spore germination protein [Paenibacillus sp.]|jgi:stage V sporulation protein AF|uniref:spore germination protein n=1 Tax=Paenibacillus sp. TaxID=58172 RepID=UPI0028364B99|nr:spore germination protein [Paenibacillus sp.]MDR0266602.1 spore germination protein [Paenibacillus sp.]